MGQLILKSANASRSSGEWSDDDYDVLAEGRVVGRLRPAPRQSARPGCGLSPSGTTKTARRRTATRRRARLRWRRLLRAGGGNRAALPLARPLASFQAVGAISPEKRAAGCSPGHSRDTSKL